MKVNVIIKHPNDDRVIAHDIDINNFGTRKRRVKYNKNNSMTVVCNVFDHKKKKCVRIGSEMVIRNGLSLNLMILVHESAHDMQ